MEAPILPPEDPAGHVHLPFAEVKSSLRADGSRDFVHPADVSGRFVFGRRITFVGLIAIWLLLPWVHIGGHPAVFLDVDRRQFFLFGSTFNAQDIWLAFFIITGLVFGLVYVTALLGRVFCGYACPQTVFLEAIYRPIERLVEGPRAKRLRLDKSPMSVEKFFTRALKHALYILASILVAHIFLGYFISFHKLFVMVRGRPSEHPDAFVWAVGTTLFFYGNFAWFREQLCLIVCPYGRLQAALIDNDSLVIGYDERRGEPRGKPSQEHGDCVDCNRCVAVCPTGIDIRNGLQLDCIGCTACIDACDDVMDRLKRPRGLVRYDSLNGLSGSPRRVLRPRIYVYTALMVLGALVASFAFRRHTDFEANVLRLGGLPYVVEGGLVRNAFEVHLVNKRATTETFVLEPKDSGGLAFVIPIHEVTLESLAQARLPVFVTYDRAAFHGDFPIEVRVRRKTVASVEATTIATAKFVGPGP